MEQQYDVFISYSRKDYVDEQKNVIPDNEVSKVKDALDAAGITYWFDEEGIYSGQNFVEKIVTNIECAKIFVFLSTANSNKSPWTCKEIASADEFKKHIIPVRLDAAPYNKKVLFRIADLDYIEYYTNPQKGIEDLIGAIKNHLDQLSAEEKRKEELEQQRKEAELKKAEELQMQRELEEEREKREQEQLVSDIKKSISITSNEEAKLELDRQLLMIRAEGVADSRIREELISLIQKGGVIHEKYKKRYAEFADKGEDAVMYNPTESELKRWNWGAFFFNWIWGLGNGLYWPLVLIVCNIIPYIGWITSLIICIVLGIKGTKWAWKAKKWDSWNSFKETQHKWAIAILWVLGVVLLLSIGYALGAESK